MCANCTPKYVRDIEFKVFSKLKTVKQITYELLEEKQKHHDEILQIYRDAFLILIDKSVTCSNLLKQIKEAYDKALDVRNDRISQFIIQDRVFGISVNKEKYNENLRKISKQCEELEEENTDLKCNIIKLMTENMKLKSKMCSDSLSLMREREERYTLPEENLAQQVKIKELSGCSISDEDTSGDPLILRIALNRCREQWKSTQAKLAKMTDEYAETVPRREFEELEVKFYQLVEDMDSVKEEHSNLQIKYNKLQALKRILDVELSELKDRCHELERAGTPRPQWELCADFIGGGRERWWQLAKDLSSRDTLRVLLKELGPAAESDHLEHFDGLGSDPMIPSYLRYEGKVRNLRLSRREISVIINDIWLGKLETGRQVPMQDYMTKYFEERYQQASVRAEWAYNLCSGAEQMLDEPQVKLFWGVVHGHLSEDIYWGLRTEWTTLKDNSYRQSKDGETLTIEDFEKIIKASFPLKSEVDVKNVLDVTRKQLKIKMNNNEINLDKLFQENEEGFDRIELARELYRQRQMAQDKYIREIVAELGGKHSPNKMISVDNLKRAFAIVDPAIDHIRMERNIRWAFSNKTSDINSIGPLPLRALALRLTAGDIVRMGPRHKGAMRRNVHK